MWLMSLDAKHVQKSYSLAEILSSINTPCPEWPQAVSLSYHDCVSEYVYTIPMA